MIPCRIDQQYIEEEQAQEGKYDQYNIGKRRSSLWTLLVPFVFFSAMLFSSLLVMMFLLLIFLIQCEVNAHTQNCADDEQYYRYCARCAVVLTI